MLSRGFLRAALPRDVPPGESVELHAEMYLPAETGRYVVRLDMVDEYLAWFESCGSRTADLALDITAYPDSSDPHRLAATIELLSGAPQGPVTPGAPLALSLRLGNAGDSLWLAGEPGVRGVVSLGVHIVHADGTTAAHDCVRIPLPHAVVPKESLDVNAVIPAPPEPGRWLLRFNLVAEGVCWFDHMGSAPLDLPVETSAETPDSLHPGVLRAAIELLRGPDLLKAAPNADVTLSARIRNLGNTAWRAGEKRRGVVALGGHLHAGGALVELDFLRVALPRDVAPGEALDLAFSFRAPPQPGAYVLELDMVDEEIAWFAQRGSQMARLELLVAATP
jgi:hypothetical protein